MFDLSERLRANLDSRGLWPEGGRLLVAVSGGVDSVCLARELAALTGSPGLKLAIGHADHGLRPESTADAEWVAGLSAELGTSFFTARLPVAEEAALSGESIEMAARRLRHQFLARAARAFGADSIALGHHRDDQAELFFLRLLRGAGSEGLGGMAWRSRSTADRALWLIRPFLDVERAELARWAAAAGWEHREDLTNNDRGILRNWVRLELLPRIAAERAPGIWATAARCAELLRDDAEFVRQTAERWLARPGGRVFSGLPIAVQRAVVRQQLWAAGLEADWQLVESLRTSPGRISTGIETWVSCGAGRLVVEKLPVPDTSARERGPLSVSLDQAAGEFAGGSLTIEWRRLARGPRYPSRGARPGREWFDASRVGSRVVFRPADPGDRFRPLGFTQAAGVKDLLVNRKIAAADRRLRWLATTGDGEIFWIEGLPPGERFKVDLSTRSWLRWSWQRRPQTPPQVSP